MTQATEPTRTQSEVMRDMAVLLGEITTYFPSKEINIRIKQVLDECSRCDEAWNTRPNQSPWEGADSAPIDLLIDVWVFDVDMEYRLPDCKLRLATEHERERWACEGNKLYWFYNELDGFGSPFGELVPKFWQPLPEGPKQ